MQLQRSLRRVLALGAFAIISGTVPATLAEAQQNRQVIRTSATGEDVAPTEMRMRDGSVVPMGDYVGTWQGMVRTASGLHRVALEVAPRTIGNGLVASMTSSMQRPFSVLVDTITIADNRVQMGMTTAGTRFTGRLNDRQTEIRGTWQQEGTSIPLTLKRVIVPARTEARPDRQSEMLAQMSDMQSPSSDLPTPPTHYRSQSLFQFGLSRKPVAYDWIPHIGNQDRAYGLYYW